MKRKSLLVISLVLVCLMVYSTTVTALTSVTVKSISLDKTSLAVNIGKTAALKATITPANATNSALLWSSSDPKIAKVSSSGVITGVKEGSAAITAKSKDGKVSAKCFVAVTKGGLVFPKPATVTMMTMSHPSYPYDPKWFVWDAIKKATGVNLKVTAYGLTEYSDKVALTLASGNLPDIMYLGIEDIHKFGLNGPWADALGSLDKTPYFNTWLNSGQVATDTIKTYKASDGKVYVYPIVGAEELMNVRGWMARKDILAKNNLPIPTTYEQLYTDMKQLKTLYPDSYPLGERDFWTGNVNSELFTPQWATGIDAYYDFDKNEWRYGPIENNFKAMIEWFRKCYSEGLVPPDLLTTNTKGWTDLMSSSKSFFTLDYMVRIDFFNKPMQVKDPSVNLDYFAPPVGSVPDGKSLMLKTNYAGGGNCVCKTKNTDNALKFVDWMYSDSGKDLLNWGTQGVTYNVVNGVRKFISDANGDNQTQMYGLASFGVNICQDLQAQSAGITKQCFDAHLASAKTSQPLFNPRWWMDFTKPEQDVKLSLQETIKSHMQENVSKFITGEIGMDQWDTYVKSIKQLGLDQYLTIFRNAYNRVK